MSKRTVTVEVPPFTHVVLVSEHWADRYRVWSEPIQVMVDPTDNPDVVTLTCRPFEAEEAERYE